MASRKTIKGISIQLSADATGLTNALQNINKKIDSTSSNLKEVNKLLKFDGSNTELIAQKQRLLGEQIDNTKKKLKALTDQQDKLNSAFENGDITQEQYDAWQREIIETEQQLKASEMSLTIQRIHLTELGSPFPDGARKSEQLRPYSMMKFCNH